MRLLRQLEFAFEQFAARVCVGRGAVVGQALHLPNPEATTEAVALQVRQRDVDLEIKARELLHANGAARIANELRVEWNSRLKTSAGRADYRHKLISLNPRLFEHPAEIDRTLRHELAHLLAQFRAGRRRILPHGAEWQQACCDLGIADEKRCHHLPFPARRYTPRFIYRCPNCRQEFPRVRRVRRAVACLACCRAHNGGEFDARFRLAADL
jgi:predicted SprT family Zn-dependent metalloprotease